MKKRRDGTTVIYRTQPELLKAMWSLSGDRWAVKLMCPDGHLRTFYTGRPQSEARRGSPSPRERFALLQSAGFRCHYCGRTAAETGLHIDHVVPLAQGGTNDPGNLVVACKDCNLGKATTAVA